MVSRNKVIQAYRELLKREPEGDEIVAAHAAHHSTSAELRNAIVNSEEYLSANKPFVPLLPAISAEQLCNFGKPVRILEPTAADGNVSLIELVILDQLVAEFSPRFIFEFGTFDGRTTVNLAANAPSGAKIYTIDLPRTQINTTPLELHREERKYVDKESSGARFVGTQHANRITQLYGDTATFDFSPWYNQVDFVFVDASHVAAYVQNDTGMALRLVGSRPSLIAWHDYGGGWRGVAEVLESLHRADSRLRELCYIRGTSLAFCKINF